MTKRRSMILMVTASLVTLAACEKKADAPAAAPEANAAAPATATPAAAPGDPVASAMSAGPASIASAAAIVAPQADGTMKSLRAGTNGWTCMPDNPATPGPDPMCLDGNAVKWAMAWMSGKTPPEGVGLAYMLAGGIDASNTDPAAKTPAAGTDWIRTGPHVMVLNAPTLNAQFKGGDAPDTKAPSVMFGGTPYAHLMVPVN